MPIQLPDLDDRRYDDLIAEALTLIPSSAPEWTDHNPSDPGITLVELFAYLTEIMIYRLNRVTDANTLGFVKLMRGPEWVRDPSKTVAAEVRAAVLEIRAREPAVTTEDFERLAMAAAPLQIARTCCLPRIDLDTASDGSRDSPGHVSIVILPSDATQPEQQPTAVLLQTVRDYLEPRRLLTTRVHVLGPSYLAVNVRIAVVPRSDYLPERVREDVLATLTSFFHPLQGGVEKQGWPFGRAVYVSEIYDLVDRVPGVDYVHRASFGNAEEDELDVKDRNRIERNANSELVSVRLRPHELPGLRVDAKTVSMVNA